MIREDRWKSLDNFKRKLFIKTELKRKIFKSIIHNKNLPNVYRYIASWQKSKLIRFGSSTQIQNRCVVSGRNWSINKQTNLSRFVFQRESYKGNIPGFNRASW